MINIVNDHLTQLDNEIEDLEMYIETETQAIKANEEDGSEVSLDLAKGFREMKAKYEAELATARKLQAFLKEQAAS